MSFGSYLKELRKKRGYSINKLALRSNISSAHISRIERGLRPAPSPHSVKALSDALGVDYNDFMAEAGYIESKIAEEQSEEKELVKIPILSFNKTRDGDKIMQSILGYEFVPKMLVNDGEYFYYRVKGNAMAGSRIQDGDLALVKRQDVVENGDIAVVIVGDKEASLKRVYYEDGMIILQADNPEYPPLTKKPKQVEILGVVEHITFKVKQKK